MPVKSEDVSEKVKFAILKHLNEKYGITERDFLSAEIEIVPAFKAKNVGLDESFVGAYGQDDRVCAFTTLKGIFAVQNPKKTALAILVDKEEIGSTGNTGMLSAFFEMTLAEIIEKINGNCTITDYNTTIENSACLSSDVGAAVDPNYESVYEKRNAAFAGCGMVLMKYTGARGKSESSDASAEFVYEIGVYGSRNVCLNLDRSSMVSIKNKFVSSSYGFSGNLGYVMPKDWAFDQFAVDLVIGSGAGKLSIDKVAVSGLDNGFNKLIDIDIEKEMIEFGTDKGLFKGLGLEIEQLNQRTGAALLSFIPKITLACELSMTSKVVGPGVETINLSMAGTDITSSILGKFNAVGVQFDKSQNFASLMNRLILVQNITPNLRYKVQFSPLGVEVTFEASSSVENSDGVVRTLYYRLIFNIDKVAWETAMIANKIQVPVEAGPTDIYEVEKEFIITDAFAAVAVVAMSAFIIKNRRTSSSISSTLFYEIYLVKIG